MQYAKVLGAGNYLPASHISNDDLAQKMDTSDEWITTRAGIEFRHAADENKKTSDLTTESARRALAAVGISAGEVDPIIIVTATPDVQFPFAATIVRHRLGVTSGCPAFDVQVACVGFMYALNTADACAESGMAKKILVVGAEAFNRILNWGDRATCMLFGDDAGAVVLDAADEPNIVHDKSQADGSYLDLLDVPGQIANGQICGTPYIKMGDPGIFKFTIKILAKVTEEMIREAGITPDQINWFVPHQADKRIIESAAKHLGLDMEKVILAVQDHGNTSAASIPLTLDADIQSGQVQRGYNLLLEGIGGGFAWDAVLLKY